MTDKRHQVSSEYEVDAPVNAWTPRPSSAILMSMTLVSFSPQSSTADCTQLSPR
ncbi:hypothetical protein [Zavarzinia compransoris]|uniref:hypothetical protein n=1 Tax=Zavarzinia compransoris TaxID=1264899 RepID=UPI001414EC3D|nr:hypothetical protein [Zavarzinia compransoris]